MKKLIFLMFIFYSLLSKAFQINDELNYIFIKTSSEVRYLQHFIKDGVISWTEFYYFDLHNNLIYVNLESQTSTKLFQFEQSASIRNFQYINENQAIIEVKSCCHPTIQFFLLDNKTKICRELFSSNEFVGNHDLFLINEEKFCFVIQHHWAKPGATIFIFDRDLNKKSFQVNDSVYGLYSDDLNIFLYFKTHKAQNNFLKIDDLVLKKLKCCNERMDFSIDYRNLDLSCLDLLCSRCSNKINFTRLKELRYVFSSQRITEDPMTKCYLKGKFSEEASLFNSENVEIATLNQILLNSKLDLKITPNCKPLLINGNIFLATYQGVLISSYLKQDDNGKIKPKRKQLNRKQRKKIKLEKLNGDFKSNKIDFYDYTKLAKPDDYQQPLNDEFDSCKIQ